MLAPGRKTIIVNDMLGRIELDAETAEVVGILTDNDSAGTLIVDDADQVEVTQNSETAKRSNVWASW